MIKQFVQAVYITIFVKSINLFYMNFKYLFFLIFSTVVFGVEGQTLDNDVLFTVDNDPIYTSEFLRVYNKNLALVQDESQKNVDGYLSLFINYKLKLKEANVLNLQENPTYISELNTYKKQLAKSFIADSNVTEALVQEAYQRVTNEIKATHILVKFSDNASPRDTLVAYNEIVKLRERAINEGFEKVRKEVHNGQTIFGEDLGYFSGFRMVYAFENAAFNTEIASVSPPFKTQFGYHIVNVLDKRASRGERSVAHIMVFEKEGDSLAEKPEHRIQDIYKKIKQGEEFEALAQQFSDDVNSASNGGKMAPFTSGQINSPEFEETAFGLEEIGDVSEPIKSAYGWHIIKLLGKKEVASFEEMKPELEQKVKQDERSKLIDDALYAKLKSKYGILEGNSALNYFSSILNDTYFENTWVLPKGFPADKPFLKIGNKQFNYKNFADYLLSTQSNTIAKTDFKTLVLNKYNTFLNTNIVQYQEDNLESENEEYAQVVAEYRDGLLLFDLMETTIWNTAVTDSLEIDNYYESNKNKYNTPERVDAIVAASNNKKTLKRVRKLLQKGMALAQIKGLINSNDKIDVIFTADIMDASHQALPENFDFKKGISDIYNHNKTYILVMVNDVLPENQKSLEEAKGLVVIDYQAYKEKAWLSELAKKYEVVVNQEVLERVKSQIKNQ